MAKREDFAHLLRGVAAVSVMFAHYCGAFFRYHEYLAGLLQVPQLDHVPGLYGVARIAGDFYVLLSQFGVGIFFILSGYVISLAIGGDSGIGFMKRRALRIFPVYIAGFSLVMAAVASLTLYAGSTFGYTLAHILSHFGIITRGAFGYPRIDGISWTLEVELVFYLLMAVAGRSVLERRSAGLITTATIVAIFAIVSSQLMQRGFYHLVGNTGFQAWAALLLVAGMAFHLHSGDLINRPSLHLNLAWIATLVALVWLSFDRNVYTWQWIAGYFVAIMVFWIAFSIRTTIRPVRLGLFGPLYRLTSHLADVSYPLYVVHALLGYGVMYWVVSNGFGAYAAIALAATASYLAAVILHVIVEEPYLRRKDAVERTAAA